MAIAMRIVTQIFFRHRDHTRTIVRCLVYAHKYTPNSRCAICSGFEDTTKKQARSRGTAWLVLRLIGRGNGSSKIEDPQPADGDTDYRFEYEWTYMGYGQ